MKILREVIRPCYPCSYDRFYLASDKKALNNIVLNLIKIYGQEEIIKYTGTGKINFIDSTNVEYVREILNDQNFLEGFM